MERNISTLSTVKDTSQVHSRGVSSTSSVMYQQYQNLNYQQKGKDISPVRPQNDSRVNPLTIDQSKYSTNINRADEAYAQTQESNDSHHTS